mmetsp:Transcript_29173/g.67855  ORF Transcript_29173/g.67855 Transcript_29173/m.67855 type:complete len:200 (+) Transcript_29173:777-1376(+)
MLHANLLRLKCSNCGLHVQEGALEDLIRSLLLDGVVSLHRQLQVFGLYVHDYQHRLWAVSPVELMNAQVGWLYLGSGRVPPDHALLGIDLLEHCEHVLMEVVIQKPDLRVPRVLLEGHGKAIGDVEIEIGDLTKQGAHHTLRGALGNAVVVVHHAQQHYGMNDNIALVFSLLCWLFGGRLVRLLVLLLRFAALLIIHCV